jgi:hypothetical protein
VPLELSEDVRGGAVVVAKDGAADTAARARSPPPQVGPDRSSAVPAHRIAAVVIQVCPKDPCDLLRGCEEEERACPIVGSRMAQAFQGVGARREILGQDDG